MSCISLANVKDSKLAAHITKENLEIQEIPVVNRRDIERPEV